MSIESKIFSLRAVTIPMILVIIAFSIKVSVLFYNSFVIDHNELRIVASIILSIPVGLTLLIVMANKNLINTYKLPITEIYFLCSIVIMLLIFGVFKEGNSTTVLFQKIFLSIFLAFVEYTYSRIFVAKYEQQTAHLDQSKTLNDIKIDYRLIQQNYDSLSKDNAKLSETETSLKKEVVSLEKYRTALFCDKCDKQFDTVSRFRNHKH